MAQAKRYAVLLVDDDPDDVELTRMMLGQATLTLDVSFSSSGADALAHLRDGRGPDLILLDLNMPLMGGLETLRALKRDPRLRGIPVVILTTSQNPDDRARSVELGAAGFLTKPMGLSGFPETARAVEGFLRAPAPTPAAG
jgi:CheY-like chemotaxis protein